MTMAAVLTEQTAARYLVQRGVLRESPTNVVELAGGVSNVVLSVSQPPRELIVKQSLPQLRVADEWLAPVERIITEGRALTLAHHLAPGCVPQLVHSDQENFVIVMERAPMTWSDWKSQLMSGNVLLSKSREIGAMIGVIHSSTSGGNHLHPDFFDAAPFEQLRLDPYYRTTAARIPELSIRILDLANELAEHRGCLVHGDLSPKNVLVPEGTAAGAWLIDWEVAHYGDPAFDLAFMLCHLTMKSVHRAGQSREFDAAASQFLEGYSQFGPVEVDSRRIFDHVGCLLLARVAGKSPAEYLLPTEQAAIMRIGRELLEHPISDITTLYAIRDRMTS